MTTKTTKIYICDNCKKEEPQDRTILWLKVERCGVYPVTWNGLYKSRPDIFGDYCSIKCLSERIERLPGEIAEYEDGIGDVYCVIMAETGATGLQAGQGVE